MGSNYGGLGGDLAVVSRRGPRVSKPIPPSFLPTHPSHPPTTVTGCKLLQCKSISLGFAMASIAGTEFGGLAAGSLAAVLSRWPRGAKRGTALSFNV